MSVSIWWRKVESSATSWKGGCFSARHRLKSSSWTSLAASIWAAEGGFISPNINLGLSVYPDAISRSIAASLLQAGDDFRFSLSDLTPAGFGGSEGAGMRKILRQFLVNRNVGGTAVELEQAAGKAYPP